MKELLKFSAVDTLFFRESRPMEAPGSSELGSVFPPPIRTVAGAVRTSIAESMGVDWEQFKNGAQEDIKAVIGSGDDYAKLRFRGVWLNYRQEFIYPSPLNLIAKGKEAARSCEEREKIERVNTLYIGPPQKCDLGDKVCLACKLDGHKQYKSLQNHWLTTSGYEKLLAGNSTSINPDTEIININTLLDEEHRLGIARDNKNRRVKDGMLYQTRHCRLKSDTSFFVEVKGHSGNVQNGLVKLGGEGRMATLESVKKNFILPAAPATGKVPGQVCKGVILYLLTPMLLPKGSFFLPGFVKTESNNGITVWQGKLYNIDLKLVSSIIGKTHREGGWDMVKHEPLGVQSMVPAGSTFYCTVEGNDLSKALERLHDQQIGDEKYLGRGHIAAGLWLSKKTQG